VLLTASKIHDGISWLPKGSVIETAEDGTIIAVHESGKQEEATYYDGILAPGFVNAHCHLELSHLKGVIPEHTGLVPFLQDVITKRSGFTDEQKVAARQKAFNQMLDNGIVALGDICNTADVADMRATGKMHFHNFVEVLGFKEIPTKEYNAAVEVYNTYAAQEEDGVMLHESITPHAPYTVSYALFRMIDEHNPDSLISVHNQETPSEDEMYIKKEGAMRTFLNSVGIDDSFFHPSGKTSLQTYMRWMQPSHQFLFIHNTCTTHEDVVAAQRLLPDVFWCLCPNANLYIENTLPDINMLLLDANNICIGTDSLSSNHKLCILSELTTIKQHYPNIDWGTLLRWATFNGAKALQMQHVVGRIEEDKKPGIIHITNLDTNPEVKRVV
jgi:cytosine/adenosine deaminase-related metal-dependent hydrolase